MSEDELVSALEAAQADRERFSDRAARSAAYERQLEAERALAAARGDQYAAVIDLGFQWDVGAPCPHLVSTDGSALLLFFLDEPDPAWDGTYLTVVDTAAPEPANLGIVEFRLVSSIRMGGPSDQGIATHPLHGSGLRSYAAHEIHNSRWLAQGSRRHHYLFAFHDGMVECAASEFRTRTVRAPFLQTFKDLAAELILRPGVEPASR